MSTTADRARRLREARKKAGFKSGSDAARTMGVPVPTFLSHENGSRGYNEYIFKYARQFKVSWVWLFSGTERTNGAPYDDLLGALRPEDQEKVLEYAGMLAAKSQR